MNSQLIKIFFLIAFTTATTGIPANSFDNWFRKWDSNRDDQWNFSDFRAANREWSFRFRHGRTFGEDEIRRMFRLVDRNGDGHVSMQDVQSLHRHWD